MAKKRILTAIGAVMIALGMQAATELTIDRIQTQQIATDCVAYILFHDDSGKGFVFPVYVDPKDGDDWILIYDEQALEGIEAVSAPQKAKKVLENGQLLIIQGDRKFTITGSPSY